jgi:hypothetical protein
MQFSLASIKHPESSIMNVKLPCNSSSFSSDMKKSDIALDDILLHYRQLGDIFDTFSMGVMIVGADRKIISLNHSAEIITGHNFL